MSLGFQFSLRGDIPVNHFKSLSKAGGSSVLFSLRLVLRLILSRSNDVCLTFLSLIANQGLIAALKPRKAEKKNVIFFINI